MHMEIKYYGWKSFRIKSGARAIITYPFSKDKGLIFPKSSAEIVVGEANLSSNLLSRISSRDRSDPFLISGPGEYEVSEIEVLGFSGGYWIKIGGIEVVFLEKVDKKSIAKIGDDFQKIGIVFLSSDSAQMVKDVLDKISPSILIPYCSSDVDKNELNSFGWAKKMLDILDLEVTHPKEFLKLDEQDLPEETQVHLLKPKV